MQNKMIGEPIKYQVELANDAAVILQKQIGTLKNENKTLKCELKKII